jgi:hypothetical protein
MTPFNGKTNVYEYNYEPIFEDYDKKNPLFVANSGYSKRMKSINC